MMYSWIWLCAIVAFAVIEAVTVQFVSIWFAGGSIAGLIASLLGADFQVQMYVFIGFTALLLICTWPLAKRLRERSYSKTNADVLVGKECVVTKDIHNLEDKGEVKINGVEWSARNTEEAPIAAGTAVVVKKIEGVKLIVEKKEVS